MIRIVDCGNIQKEEPASVSQLAGYGVDTKAAEDVARTIAYDELVDGAIDSATGAGEFVNPLVGGDMQLCCSLDAPSIGDFLQCVFALPGNI
eukprot:4109087-Alexandrium_andersonii.AAC.1